MGQDHEAMADLQLVLGHSHAAQGLPGDDGAAPGRHVAVVQGAAVLQAHGGQQAHGGEGLRGEHAGLLRWLGRLCRLWRGLLRILCTCTLATSQQVKCTAGVMWQEAWAGSQAGLPLMAVEIP